MRDLDAPLRRIGIDDLVSTSGQLDKSGRLSGAGHSGDQHSGHRTYVSPRPAVSRHDLDEESAKPFTAVAG